jgi:hypothetical protein
MNTPVVAEERLSTASATANPYLVGGLAALSVGAAAIHFAAIFEHFSEYLLYGVFFLIIAWAQAIWAAVVLWRPSRLWLWLGIAGNAIIVVVYFASRLTGLPFGPDKRHTEAFGALDLVSVVFEVALVAGCAALLWQPSLLDRPVRRRTGFAGIASLAAFPAVVIAVSTAVMTPGWAGPEGPAGMAASMSSSLSAAAAAPRAQSSMGDMGTTDGLPDMKMYGSTAPATAAQVIAAANLIKATDASLVRYKNVPGTRTCGPRSRRDTPESCAPTARSTCSTTATTAPTLVSTRSTRARWSTRSTCRTTRRFCSAPCTSGTRTRLRSAAR